MYDATCRSWPTWIPTRERGGVLVLGTFKHWLCRKMFGIEKRAQDFDTFKEKNKNNSNITEWVNLKDMKRSTRKYSTRYLLFPPLVIPVPNGPCRVFRSSSFLKTFSVVFLFFWGGGHFLEWAPLPLVAEGRDDHRCREKDRGTICNRGSLTRRQPMALMWCKQQQEVTECDKKNTRHEKGERN